MLTYDDHKGICSNIYDDDVIEDSMKINSTKIIKYSIAKKHP